MSVQFEWQAGNEDGRWEVIAKTGPRPKRKRFRWVLGAVLVLIVVTGAGGYLLARRRYAQAVGQATFQVQSVIDLEARAFQEGNKILYLEQQDSASPDWYARQQRRVSQDCERSRSGDSLGSIDDGCFPVLPAKIQHIDLRDDVAWAEVIEGQSPVRRVRFYRRTDLGWKHTAPRDEFWNVAIELHYGDLLARYHRRDAPDIDLLIEHIYQVYDDVCTQIECPADNRTLTVNFVTQVPGLEGTGELPRLDGSQLFLPSPWLSGLPVGETWDASYLQELTHWAAYAAAAKAIRTDPDQKLSVLQQVILDEYTVWYSEREEADAALLKRIVQLHGADALPEVFRWIRDTQGTQNLRTFTNRWLSLPSIGAEKAPHAVSAPLGTHPLS